METMSVIFIALSSVVLLYSVITNVIVIIVVLRSRQMRTVTNILLVNLAVSDILLAGVVLPMEFHNYFECRFSKFMYCICMDAIVHLIKYILTE